MRDIVVNLVLARSKSARRARRWQPLWRHINYSDEGAVALETGGGIFNALARLAPDPFIVVNGDIWTDFDFSRLVHGIADDNTLAHLVLVPNPSQHPHGDFGLDGAQVVERPTGRHTFSGIGIYRAELFAGCEPGKFPLAPLLKRAIAERRLSGELYRGQWWDVGSPERLALLDARLGAGASLPS